MRDKNRVVFKVKDTDDYYFYDGIEDFLDAYDVGSVDKNNPCVVEIIGYVNENSREFHECNHSAVWETIAPDYVDALQNEPYMAEGKYVVCWYEYDNNYDLNQRVDYGITKERIIQNVIDQKYREGADYYLMDEIELYVDEPKKEKKLKKYRLTYEIVLEAEAEDEDHAIELADTIWAEGNFDLNPYIEEME